MMRLAPLLLCGCGSDLPDCLARELPDCEPLYEPVFEEVFTQTLQPTCGVSGCHDGGTGRAGLVLDDADVAYDALVADGRVSPGDPSCSLVMVRLEAGGADGMPPGAPLSDAERCAIQLWIDDGAER